jgi:type IV pilus assembly protein PilO
MAKLNLQSIPKPARIAIIVVPALILASLVAFLAIMPKTKQLKGLGDEIAAQENEITKTQSMAAKLDVLKAENEGLRKRLDELSEQLPEEKEISQLLSQVSGKGTDSGLTILTWKPADRQLHPSQIVYAVPVSVNVKGSYHRFGQFLSSLTRLKRIVNINDIKMGGAAVQGDEAAMTINFTAVTFTAAETGGLAK